MKVMMAIGNDTLEALILDLGVDCYESDPDIEVITDVLEFEKPDFIIVNTLLSVRKTLKLAERAKEVSGGQIKIIAIVETMEDTETLAGLIAHGVFAFVEIDELEKITEYLRDYPKSFNFMRLSGASRSAGNGDDPGKNQCVQESMTITQFKGITSIGVFGVHRGAGTTKTAMMITEMLTGRGYPVLCIGLPESEDFLHLGKTYKGTYLIPEDEERRQKLTRDAYISGDYSYIVYDFGYFFNNITKLNKVSGILIPEFMNISLLNDLNSCPYKFGLGFSDSWQRSQFDYLLSNFSSVLEMDRIEWIFSGENFEELRADYPELIFQNRETIEEQLESKMQFWASAPRIKETKRRFFGGRKK